MQPDDTMSSAFIRSLPKPPQIVSLPVPPTIQSLPRSPKSTSSPSLWANAVARQVLPLGEVSTQPLIDGPSVLDQLRKNWRSVGAGPSRSLHTWLPWIVSWQLHGVPSSWNRIARRGSYSL